MLAKDLKEMCRRLRELSGEVCEEAWYWSTVAQGDRGHIRFAQNYPASAEAKVYVCAYPAYSSAPDAEYTIVFDDVYLEVDYDWNPGDDEFQEFLAAVRRAQDLATLIRRVFAPAKPSED